MNHIHRTSPSRQYIMITAHVERERNFDLFQLPETCMNNSAIASNVYLREKLNRVPANEAGLLVDIIPLEDFLTSPVLREVFSQSCVASRS